MHFCPSCGNLLMVEQREMHQSFCCYTCPYIFPITKTFVSRRSFQRKQVDDVLGGQEAWKNVASTNITCPKCEHDRAYFIQIQIRSADEPSSIFYKCCNLSCDYQWREG